MNNISIIKRILKEVVNGNSLAIVTFLYSRAGGSQNVFLIREQNHLRRVYNHAKAHPQAIIRVKFIPYSVHDFDCEILVPNKQGELVYGAY